MRMIWHGVEGGMAQKSSENISKGSTLHQLARPPTGQSMYGTGLKIKFQPKFGKVTLKCNLVKA